MLNDAKINTNLELNKPNTAITIKAEVEEEEGRRRYNGTCICRCKKNNDLCYENYW